MVSAARHVEAPISATVASTMPSNKGEERVFPVFQDKITNLKGSPGKSHISERSEPSEQSQD